MSEKTQYSTLNIQHNEMSDKKLSVSEEKSFAFAVKVVETMKEVQLKHKEHDLTRQLLRSGTSIGANVSEAQKAQSKKDFISKMSIASKEANEACYWIRLMTATGYLDETISVELIALANELVRILTSIVKTSQEKHSTLNT